MNTITSPFSGLYEPILDISAYLNRIGLSSRPEVTVDGLAVLMRAHSIAVPFENLSVFHGHEEPSLNTADLFQKLVIEKRGGYCFELNGLFCRLLQVLGFDAWCCIARIAYHRDFLAPPAHCIVLVRINGIVYFADVGFGGPVPSSPVPVTDDGIHICAVGRQYRFKMMDKQWIMELLEDDSFVPLLVFSEKPTDFADFIPLNAFCACSRYEPFRKKQMVWRLTEDGKISIDGDLFRVVKNGVVTEEFLDSDGALHDALLTHFGIVYPGTLRDWR